MIRLSMPCKRTNSIKGAKQVHVKTNKSHEKMGATVMLSCSNLGEKKPATIVFKNRNTLSHRLMSELSIPSNVNVKSSKSGWMNKSLLTTWYKENFIGNENHIMDVAGAHISDKFNHETKTANLIYIPAGMHRYFTTTRCVCKQSIQRLHQILLQKQPAEVHDLKISELSPTYDRCSGMCLE